MRVNNPPKPPTLIETHPSSLFYTIPRGDPVENDPTILPSYPHCVSPLPLHKLHSSGCARPRKRVKGEEVRWREEGGGAHYVLFFHHLDLFPFLSFTAHTLLSPSSSTPPSPPYPLPSELYAIARSCRIRTTLERTFRPTPLPLCHGPLRQRLCLRGCNSRLSRQSLLRPLLQLRLQLRLRLRLPLRRRHQQ